jgi:hypothetical protein
MGIPCGPRGTAWGSTMLGQHVNMGIPGRGSCTMLYMGQILPSHVVHHVG